ncbi:MAG: DUF3576 domain-containing protein [Rhodospirillales bacterium]|nr:DUF3576 domain-containing protein [Rhodospirillales bacterium]
MRNRQFYLNIFSCAVLALTLLAVSACEGLKPDPVVEEKRETIFGEGGFQLFGDDKKKNLDRGGEIGVNAFLWRAALDTINFMPVASADPFGGVIITDWHSPSGTANERFKLNIYILGRALRADGIRVSAFRQVRDASGWRDVPMPSDTSLKIEDSILTKARQIRHTNLEINK